MEIFLETPAPIGAVTSKRFFCLVSVEDDFSMPTPKPLPGADTLTIRTAGAAERTEVRLRLAQDFRGSCGYGVIEADAPMTLSQAQTFSLRRGGREVAHGVVTLIPPADPTVPLLDDSE